MDSKLYRIKELESLSGIKAHTLRIWEKRYKILNPIRTETNLRRYSQEDLNRIINVSVLYNYGWKISKVATLSDDELSMHCEEALNKQAGSYAEMAELLFAVNSFNIKSFDNQLAKYYEKFGHERVLVSIVAPLVERLALLSVLNRLDKVIEEFFLNRLMVNIIEQAAKFPATTNKHAKKILIIQSQQNLIPINHVIVNLLSLIFNYNVVVYLNYVDNEYLKRINTLFKPDFVFTEISKATSDNMVIKRAKAMNKAFKKSSVFFCGKKVELLAGELPEGVYYVENVRDFYRTM